jgi:hypothetical protein
MRNPKFQILFGIWLVKEFGTKFSSSFGRIWVFQSEGTHLGVLEMVKEFDKCYLSIQRELWTSVSQQISPQVWSFVEIEMFNPIRIVNNIRDQVDKLVDDLIWKQMMLFQ